jgi:3-methyladenine DNA glycosylase Tag
VDGEPKQNRYRRMADIPAETQESRALAKALNARGFRFCGPTTLHAFMQSVGMVNALGLAGTSISRDRADPCCADRCALPGSFRPVS